MFQTVETTMGVETDWLGKDLGRRGGERGGQRREGVKRVHGCYVPIAACHHLHVLGEEDHRYQTLSST